MSRRTDTSADHKYNGWTNYETWAVNVWMSNDQGSDEYYRELAQETYNRAEAEHSFTRDEVATRNLSDTLEGEFDERQSELVGVTGVFADLLNAAMSEVNWFEIAEHYMSDVDKESEEAGARLFQCNFRLVCQRNTGRVRSRTLLALTKKHTKAYNDHK